MSKIHLIEKAKGSKKSAGGGSAGSGGGDISSKLVILEERSKHCATKEDIKDIKIWVLIGVVGGMLGATALAVSITLSAVKLFM